MNQELQPSRKELKRQKRQLRADALITQQNQESRRRFLIAGAGVTGIIILGGGGAWYLATNYGQGSANPEYDELLKQYRMDEKRFEPVLGRADEAINELTNIASEVIRSDDPNRSRLLAPLQVYADNKEHNPSRNRYRYYREDLEKRGPDALKNPSIQQSTGPSHFFMDFLKIEGAAAGFSPTGRRVGIKESFDPNNLLDAIVLYHELEIVRQDSEIRKGLTSQKEIQSYIAFYDSGIPRVIGALEQEAYLKEVMLINAISGGKLQQDIERGAELDQDFYLKLLNARDDQKPLVEFVLQIAKEAYSSGTNLDYYAGSYVTFINNQYKARGYEVYEAVNGNLVRV